MNNNSLKNFAWRVIIPYIAFLLVPIAIYIAAISDGLSIFHNSDNLSEFIGFSLFFGGFVYGILSSLLWKNKYKKDKSSSSVVIGDGIFERLLFKFLYNCLLGAIMIFIDIPMLVSSIKDLLGKN